MILLAIIFFTVSMITSGFALYVVLDSNDHSIAKVINSIFWAAMFVGSVYGIIRALMGIPPSVVLIFGLSILVICIIYMGTHDSRDATGGEVHAVAISFIIGGILAIGGGFSLFT